MTQMKDTLPRPQVEAAEAAVAEARQARFPFRDYNTVVRQLPALLQRHGLGLTLAYLQMRGAGNQNSPYDLVYRQMDRWLQKALGLNVRGFLGALCSRDSRFYLEASNQASLLVRALSACLEEQQ
jgi:hypothetical protein